jgi:hypothetical protein
VAVEVDHHVVRREIAVDRPERPPVVVDRLVGLLALSTPPIILGLVWHRSALGGYAVAAALALALVTWQLSRVLTFAARLVPSRWPRARAFFDALPAGVASVPVGPRLEAFCWSVLYQGCVGSFFELVAAKWGSDPRYETDFLATTAKMEKYIPAEEEVLEKMYESTKEETDALRANVSLTSLV